MPNVDEYLLVFYFTFYIRIKSFSAALSIATNYRTGMESEYPRRPHYFSVPISP